MRRACADSDPADSRYAHGSTDARCIVVKKNSNMNRSFIR